MNCIPKWCVLTLAVAALASVANAQGGFRAVQSGDWSDSRNWEQKNGGIWLRPPDGVYPGSERSRNVDVIVDSDVQLTLSSGPEVRIHSLRISGGKLEIKGKMVIGPTSDDPNNSILITPDEGTIGLSDVVTEPAHPEEQASTQVEIPLTLEQNVPNPVSFVTGDWTSIRFYLDRSYPMVRLSLFDQMGSELKRLYDDAEPGVGWHSVRMNVRDLQSGSYPIVLQAGGRLLRRSLTVIR